MALVKCAECSREISDKAAACPGCGAPIASMSPVPECNASTKRVVGEPVTSCAVCRIDVPVGSRWCPICRTNVIDPTVGRLATPGSRIEAYVIDVAILVALLLLGIIVKGLGALLFLVYAAVYLIVLAHGVTPGKNMVGIHVVKESGETAGFGTMLLRETIGKIVSGMIFSLGYIWVLIDKDRQAWHDKLAGTYVCSGSPSTRTSVTAVAPSGGCRHFRDGLPSGMDACPFCADPDSIRKVPAEPGRFRCLYCARTFREREASCPHCGTAKGRQA